MTEKEKEMEERKIIKKSKINNPYVSTFICYASFSTASYNEKKRRKQRNPMVFDIQAASPPRAPRRRVRTNPHDGNVRHERPDAAPNGNEIDAFHGNEVVTRSREGARARHSAVFSRANDVKPRHHRVRNSNVRVLQVRNHLEPCEVVGRQRRRQEIPRKETAELQEERENNG